MKNLVYILILFPSLIFSQTVGFKYHAIVKQKPALTEENIIISVEYIHLKLLMEIELRK
tara:strand:+ start:450 stop:626 length:177 start_codon:yes stop_codon:yes gene_type:complete